MPFPLQPAPDKKCSLFMSCRGRFHPVQGLGTTKPATCNQPPSSVQPPDITAAFSRVVPRKGFRQCSALKATTSM